MELVSYFHISCSMCYVSLYRDGRSCAEEPQVTSVMGLSARNVWRGKKSVCREIVWLLPHTRNRWRRQWSQWTSARGLDYSALSSGLQEPNKWVGVFCIASMKRRARTGCDWREHIWPWMLGQVLLSLGWPCWYQFVRFLIYTTYQTKIQICVQLDVFHVQL
jgi:hypothetical protein